MALPHGQRYVVVDGSSPFNCDISTNPTTGRYIATSVGDSGQSTVCWDCALAIYELVKAEKDKNRTSTARAARQPAEA